MCRNIKTLFNFEPPATELECRAAALQYVRKVSGMNATSEANREAFEHAVETMTALTIELMDALETRSPPRTREEEAERAKERGRKREEQLRARLLGATFTPAE